MGKRRKADKPKPGDSGGYDGLTPEQKGQAFNGMFGRSKIRAADKMVRGQAPYQDEPTSKKHRFGRKS